MQESTGVPSSNTVQAPQWPSPHAIFVPVRPTSSRSVSASVRPTDTSTEYRRPLTSSSVNRRHREDVGDVDQAERRAPDRDPLSFLDLRQRAPEVARRLEQLTDPVDLLDVSVA